MYTEAIFHRPINQFAYGYDKETIHLQLQTEKQDIEKVTLIYGDPYHFENGNWEYYQKEMRKTGTDSQYDYWQITIKPEYRRLRYGFCCEDTEGDMLIITERGYFKKIPQDIGDFFCFPYLHEADIFQAPEWVKDTVWYQIFPERFANGDSSLNPEGTLPWGSEKPTSTNFFGGDFQGVINHLDYLVELGVNGIYFTPIFKAYSNHKYDTIDYFEIDPQFGDKKTFRKLVEECHKREIKVMLDAVFNHSGYYFEPFQDVLRNQENSSYKDWFHLWDFPVMPKGYPNYDAFGFVASMPKLNTTNPETKKYLLDVARYWIEEFDIDGWRLDVANEVDHAFWRDFRKVVKEAKPSAYILGEIWHDSMKWLQGDQFDAVMNYPFTNGAVEFFAANNMNSQTFADTITKVLHMYPKNVNEVAFNLLDSHDTPRTLTLANENKERIRLLYLFQFSFIGSPCIYYGDEIGLSGGGDPECRKCMEWDQAKQDLTLFEFVKTLLQMRKEIPAFGNRSDFKFLKVEKNVIAYQKKNKEGNLIFILNNSNEKQTMVVSALENKKVKEMFTGQDIIFSNKAELHLDQFGYRCYQILE
ncbi:glycoside hydrolase family 13 protein [Gracilibacillus massiliensis]|uniref:glycoside hydrolase family 13 protein n=1 Tax=Gracilibacillus massiliensis TaxID=1564956 RepID=UPI00071C7AE3|nr:glycoside hydrolase family 13 protein [Gracilibacillus massiliensis]